MSNQNPIEIVVHADNAAEFVQCTRVIQQYLDHDADIPATIVRVFFDLMKSKTRYQSNLLFAEAKKKAVSAVERMPKSDEYTFEWMDREIPGVDEKFPNNTQLIFEEIIFAYKLYEADHPMSGRDEAVGFFYQVFEEKYKRLMTQECQLRFSNYKQRVVSGLLTEAVGFKITLHEASLKEIFDKTRNAIKKSWEYFSDN